MEDIFSHFTDLLRTRLENNVFTTEDSVRYTFFAALLQIGVRPDQVVLESRHPTLPKAQIDTVIDPSVWGHRIAIEFKYDRQIPSGRNAPRPQKAGKLFLDIYRLVQLNETERLFVYLTDEEMASYLRNVQNGLDDFFELAREGVLVIDQSYTATKSDTFKKALGHDLTARLNCLWTEALPRNHFLRVYRVEI